MLVPAQNQSACTAATPESMGAAAKAISAVSVEAGPVKWHNQPYSLRLTLPPLSASFFLSQGGTASP